MRKLWIISLLLFLSCESEDDIPENVIPKEKFMEILYDTEIIDALRSQYLGQNDSIDVMSFERYNLVFQQHKISQPEFQNSFEFYQTKPQIMLEISDSIIARLIREEEIVSKELRSVRWRKKEGQEP